MIRCAATVPLDPARTVSELRELARLTSDDGGAQRVCWTPVWARARDWLAERLAALPVTVETDEAGNRWATLEGRSPRAAPHRRPPRLGPQRRLARRLAQRAGGPRGAAAHRGGRRARGHRQPGRLGRRGGRSLRAEPVRLERRVGKPRPRDRSRPARPRRRVDAATCWRAAACVSTACSTPAGACADAAAYLELHIEQGPVLESMGLPLGVVTGTFAAERHQVTFHGQAAHAGSTPMHLRRDALAGAVAPRARGTRDRARRGRRRHRGMDPGPARAFRTSCPGSAR